MSDIGSVRPPAEAGGDDGAAGAGQTVAPRTSPGAGRRDGAAADCQDGSPPQPGPAAAPWPQRRRLPLVWEFACLYLGLGFLGFLCLLWTPFALLLHPFLPRAVGRRCGRYMISFGFRIYLGWLRLLGACRFDLSELDALRGQGPLILAPNHPCLLDAVMLVSRLPRVVCVMKSTLMDNLFLGAGARLARYIRNEPPLAMVMSAVEDLAQGSHLLVFPEGTRTTRWPLGPLKSSTGLIAVRARVPVQAIFIETDSPYLCKGWPLFRRPEMPITYRVRLGKRFDPPSDVSHFMAELEAHFRAGLADARLPDFPPAPPPA